jgi:mxaJ protein
MKTWPTVSALLVSAASLSSDARAIPTASRVLRVCADPAGLPFSNDRLEGFENRVAALLASDLGATLEYTWWPLRRGFLRNTLSAGRCDVVIGVPEGYGGRGVTTTKPWYRSTYAFVSRKERHLEGLRSIDDPRLRTLRIGVPLAGDDGVNPPPLHALTRRGIIDGVRGFHLYAELGRTIPAAIEAVDDATIDVALLWGPVAGAGARKTRTELVVVPVREQRDAEEQFEFAIAMGTRRSDESLARELDDFIVRRRAPLERILSESSVPVIAPMEPSHAP